MKYIYMKHLLFTMTAAMACALTGYANPAYPGLLEQTQPDGTTVNMRLVGDEHFHFFMTEDGFAAERGQDGFFYLLDATTSGEVFTTNIRVATPEAKNFTATREANTIIESMYDNSLERSRRKSPAKVIGTTTFPTLRKCKGLVVLVEYKDVKFTIDNPRDEFDRMMNEEGYNDYGTLGSAADWFKQNSNGLFDIEFDVVGPITLNNNMSYYGGNNDAYAYMMVVEACRQLDSDLDFTQYDVDKNGVIDNVYVFYAGYSEAEGGPAESVWPHSWDIGYFTNEVFDGVKLNHYACSSELDHNNRHVGIGTFVHEFGHVLGLSDHYSTTYNNLCFTPGNWDVMDTGQYNNDSRTPPYYNAFERYFLGWLEPEEINYDYMECSLDPIYENQAYIIRTARENEYFFLENRQQDGWDRFLPYHGMLIWHIDFNQTVWDQDIVNDDPNHQRVDIEEADGTQTSTSRNGDCFPGVRDKTSFTDETRPNMLAWDGTPQNRPITDIREENGIIYFTANADKKDLETGVNHVTANGETLKVYVNGTTLRVINEAGSFVNVYSTDGRLVGRTSDKRAVIDVAASGCYIVTDGITTCKVVTTK